MKFKPMLAGKCSDTTTLRYPVLASKKLDGVRCLVQDGRLVSRTLKPIPNKHVQNKFIGLPEGTDGELIIGDPRAADAYRKTVSVVMSDDKPTNFYDGEETYFYIFDTFLPSAPFTERIAMTADTADKFYRQDVDYVKQVVVQNAEELAKLEEMWLAEGYEGVMLRDPKGPYKEGRSSENQGWLLKLKQFEDGEARIIDFVEECENTNTATTNALGRTERSTAKAGMVGKGRLGKFEVVGVGGTYDGVLFSVGGGFTVEMRQSFWNMQPLLRGNILKFKYFASGSKDKPRFPVFLGWRDGRDM
jgi:DNA ligase-1